MQFWPNWAEDEQILSHLLITFNKRNTDQNTANRISDQYQNTKIDIFIVWRVKLDLNPIACPDRMYSPDRAHHQTEVIRLPQLVNCTDRPDPTVYMKFFEPK